MGVHLRLVWPQWQGAGSSSVRALASEFPFGVARRGYAVGTSVLQAILPEHEGPTAVVPTEMGDRGLAERDGIEAKDVVLEQLGAALQLIADHDPARITTLGGDCAVSVAPFAALAARYCADLAVVWIDSHPDVDTGDTAYEGYHAMAVSALAGQGDADVLSALPATLSPDRVALVGVHQWEDDAHANVEAWGLPVFTPDVLREDSGALLDWLRSTGATRVAIHFDVDTIDAAEARLGLGEDFGGLTVAQARRVVADVEAAAEVVGLTIAEYVPRQVMQLQGLLDGFPV
ncbi:MAG: arginase family protein [Tessaracoccus sp.]|uniref:arginase family protein n=1 Tax=Tessaracoccus sp. TaxID=1971211 RepID=UPI001EC1DD5B|nr:arginase family protein [Tessaracoccus sp.]MBK7821596.1 arginase family protein [Tessaracoccus sp.]